MQQMIWIIHTSESMAQTLQENKHKLKKKTKQVEKVSVLLTRLLLLLSLPMLLLPSSSPELWRRITTLFPSPQMGTRDSTNKTCKGFNKQKKELMLLL